MIVIKSVCKRVRMSGRAIIRAEPRIEASKAPTVVTERAVHSYLGQFSLSLFILDSLLSMFYSARRASIGSSFAALFAG
jgi:hypothetical protein